MWRTAKHPLLSPPNSGTGPGPRERSRFPFVTGEKSRPRPLGRGRFPIAQAPRSEGAGRPADGGSTVAFLEVGSSSNVADPRGGTARRL